jgi:hypothetical protein
MMMSKDFSIAKNFKKFKMTFKISKRLKMS